MCCTPQANTWLTQADAYHITTEGPARPGCTGRLPCDAVAASLEVTLSTVPKPAVVSQLCTPSISSTAACGRTDARGEALKPLQAARSFAASASSALEGDCTPAWSQQPGPAASGSAPAAAAAAAPALETCQTCCSATSLNTLIGRAGGETAPNALCTAPCSHHGKLQIQRGCNTRPLQAAHRPCEPALAPCAARHALRLA